MTTAPERFHPDCVVCSPHCDHGLKVDFHLDERDHTVASFGCQAAYQGYPGRLHGGVICSLLDGAMTHWLHLHGHHAVTARLDVRFRHPVEVENPSEIDAWLVEARPPVFRMKSRITQHNQCKADAEATFVLLKT